MALRTILLATDLSCRCDRALDRAVALAAEWHARLIVLHVLQEPEPVTDLPSWRRPTDALQAARHRVWNDLRGAEGVEIEVLVERGDPATIILEVTQRLQCELILTGIARDETLGRVLLGTITKTLARKAAVPLLVVKSRPRGPYRNVVVATDFSEGSRCALETALKLLSSAKLSLFHAYDVIFEGLIDDKMAARESARLAAEEEMKAFLAATPAASGRSIATFCEYGKVGALLQDMVQVRGIDLVVMGSQGRGVLRDMILGSVAQDLLSGLTIDTLLVRKQTAEGPN